MFGLYPNTNVSTQDMEAIKKASISSITIESTAIPTSKTKPQTAESKTTTLEETQTKTNTETSNKSKSKSKSNFATEIITSIKSKPTIFEAKYYLRLLGTSNFTLLSILTSVIYEQYDLTVLATMVWVTSIIYWSYPTRGKRRLVDMACVALGLGSSFFKNMLQVGSEDTTTYMLKIAHYIVLFSSCFCYLKARQSSKADNPHNDTIWHMSLHLSWHFSWH